MSISVNGQSSVPPGFRFHPTEEELLNYYLRKKVASEKIDLDVIRDVDLNKLEPWDIQEKCRIASTPQNDWYFFSHKDKKYPTGTRTNRATAVGFWKATGRDKVIYTACRRIGMRKTLVFYKGRAPHGQKSDWIMHEYRLDDHSDLNPNSNNTSSFMGAEIASQEDGWVVCRVFKKKNHHHQQKAIGSPNNKCSSSITTDHHPKTQLLHSASDDALDQILQYMGRSCKQDAQVTFNNVYDRGLLGIPGAPSVRYLRPIDTVFGSGAQEERFMKLPALESPTYPPPPPAMSYAALPLDTQPCYMPETPRAVPSTDWATFDRLLASQLNGHPAEPSMDDDVGFSFCPASKLLAAACDYEEGGSVDDGDLWSLARSASSASDHVSL